MDSSFTVNEPERFELGQKITYTYNERWWKRAWNWVTRYKPPVLVVTSIDTEQGTMTVDVK